MVDVDRDGYLRELDAWNEAVAVELAAQDGITLTDAHWAVIRTLRTFYAQTHVAPAMRPLVKLIGEQLGKELGTSVYLLRLFPGNPAKVAAKIAGLPRPTNCL